MKIRNLIILLLFLVCNTVSDAQQIMHIGFSEGLMGQRIFRVAQDNKGFIWISNRFGVSRYDGKKVDNYALSLLTDAYPVRSFDVLADKDSCIWVYTSSGGIYKYNSNTNSFDLYKNLKNYLRTMSFDENNQIWFGTVSFIGWVNNDKIETVDHYLLKDRMIKQIIHYKPQEKVVITDCSVLHFDQQTKQVRNLLTEDDQAMLGRVQIESAYYDKKKDEVWLGTNGNGVWLFSLKTNLLQQISSLSQNIPPISSILTLNDSYTMIGTDGDGLMLLDRKTHTISSQYKKNSSFGLNLNGDAVYNLFRDKDSCIWVATSGGVNMIDFAQQGFRVIQHQTEDPNSPATDIITCILEDSNKNQWFGTSKGLSFKNVKTNKWTHFLQSHYIQTLYIDSKQQLWVGTYGSGAYVLDLKGNILKHLTRQNNSDDGLSTDLIYAIIEDQNQDVWLGGKKGKITKYNAKSNKFTRIPIAPVNSFVMKDNNTLMVASEVGLYEVDIHTNHINEPAFNNKLISKYISDVHIESDSIIWMATYGAGLVRCNTKTNKLEYISNEKGITPNICHRILLDDHKEYIWVTSENKINKVNVKNYEIESFSQGYVPSNITYIQTSGTKTSEGELIFGTNSGYISLHPDLIKSKKANVRLTFLDFSLFNKMILPNVAESPLNQPLDNTDRIELNHDQHSFSISFTAINFSQSVDCKYSWKLEGFDEEWTVPSKKNIANYTNLNPNKYVFRVKVLGNNQEVLDERIIECIVKPAFYNTWYAYIFYILSLVGIVYWFIKQSNTRYYLKSSLEFEKRENEKNEELTQSKLRFFTNISHEIRTPVTLIIGQAESLLHSHNIHPSVYNKIINIHKNASNLSGLINELLDFRKQEQNHMILKITSINFVDFLKETFLIFHEYAMNNNVSFSFNRSSDSIDLWIDIEQMQKVINNLLSNAFKFTPKGGKILISVEEKNDEVVLSISDTGQGILPDKIDYIFNRFYQADQPGNVPGTGIGLALTKGIIELHAGTIEVESEVNKGTTFYVKLKTGDSHFPENTIRLEKKEEIFDYQDSSPLLIEEVVDEMNGSDKDKSKLLIVEDNLDLRTFLSETFSPIYKVEVAEDGLDGLEKVRSFLPDIVITDIMMPGMSGIELCYKIKNNFDTCHIPVILLTAKTALEHKFEGLRIGADDYISKPFNVKLLILRCNNLVNSRRLMQSRYVHEVDLDNQPQVATTEMDQRFMEKATTLVEDNLSNSEFDVKQFATEVGLSRSSLFNKLKGITGLTPNVFISNIRLKKAAEMLLNNPELNISDVAYSLGFSSPRYFNKCFKDLFGYPPLEYRKMNKK